MKPSVEISFLLRALDEAFERKSWHGTNLRGSLRGVTAEDASRRPAGGRHNIWELAVHAAYWKYVVRRSLTGEKRGGFFLKGSNWWERPGDMVSGDWKVEVAALVEEHRALREAVAALDPRRLTEPTARGGTDLHGLIQGVAAHDLYHAGQIQLIKRLTAA